MRITDLRKLDLNLLPVLDILIQDRSVSRAAERLGLTQSAVSHALARLREQIGDPLLVKMNGRMEPTPFALRFIAMVHPGLGAITRALEDRGGFSPESSARKFRVALPDFALPWVCSLVSLAREHAPHVTFEWVLPTRSTLAAVAEGQLDLGLLPFSPRNADGVESESVCSAPWACFLRVDHPALGDWGQDAWQRWPHLQVGACDITRNRVADAVAAGKLERHIGLIVPSFGLVAPLLARSDLIATLPAFALARDCTTHALVQAPCPVPMGAMVMTLIWSTRLAEDPAIRWLRQALRDAFHGYS